MPSSNHNLKTKRSCLCTTGNLPSCHNTLTNDGQVGGLLQVLLLPPPIKLTATI
jgi:hypothetical protein